MATETTVPTTHKRLLEWVDEVAALSQPDRRWCNGSPEEYDGLCQALVDAGTLSGSGRQAPELLLALLRPGDVARVEDRTFICSESEDDAGPTNNWRDPSEMRATTERAVRRLHARAHDVRRAVLDGPARLADRQDRRRAHRLPLRRRLHADHDPHGRRRAGPLGERRRVRALHALGRRATGRGQEEPRPGRAMRTSTSSISPRRARSGPTARATAATRCWARSASRCGSPR